jgi:hypothetical protein
LGRTDGGDVAAGAAADDDDVELIGHDVVVFSRLSRDHSRNEDPQQDVKQQACTPEQKQQGKRHAPDPGLHPGQARHAATHAAQPSVITRTPQAVHARQHRIAVPSDM